jgi:hypothetical protein
MRTQILVKKGKVFPKTVKNDFFPTSNGYLQIIRVNPDPTMVVKFPDPADYRSGSGSATKEMSQSAKHRNLLTFTLFKYPKTMRAYYKLYVTNISEQYK